MKFVRIKLFFSILFVLILIALALPEFSVNLFGRQFNYPAIDLTPVGIEAEFPSLVQGKGLYDSTEFLVKISALEDEDVTIDHEQATSTLNTVKARANYANLTDLELSLIEQNDEYYISVIAPPNYRTPELIVEWLTVKGEIEVNVSDLQSGQEIIIKDYEILTASRNSSIRIEDPSGQVSRVTVPNLLLTVTKNQEDSMFALRNLLANRTEESIMLAHVRIDNQPRFELVPDSSNVQWLRAIPLQQGESDLSPTEISLYMSVVQSYFQEEAPLALNMNIEAQSTVPAEFNPEGLRFVLISLILGLIAANFFLAKWIGNKNTVLLNFMLAYSILLTIVILKLVRAPLSINLIVALIISLIINSLILIELFKNKQAVKNLGNLKEVTMPVTVLAASLLLIYRLQLSSGFLTEFVGVFLAFAIALIICLYTVYAFLINAFFIHKLDPLTLIKFRK